MKRLALFVSVFALAACSAKEEAPAADTAAAMAAPAAAPAMDSAAPAMPNDSTHAGMKMDSAAAPADTAKKM